MLTPLQINIILIIVTLSRSELKVNTLTKVKYECITSVLRELGMDTSVTLLSKSKNSYNLIQEDKIIEHIKNLASQILFYDQTVIVDINSALYIKVVILLVSDLSAIKEFFANWRKSLYFKNQSKYFIIYLGFEDIKKITEITWRIHATQVVIMDVNYDIHVLKGYTADNCRLTSTQKLTSCLDKQGISEVFTRKYRQFYGCPFLVMANKAMKPSVVDVKSLVYRGFEPLLIEKMGAKYNFTVKYLDHNYTHNKPFAGSPLGVIPCCMYSSLWDGKADIMIGMYCSQNTTYYFDVSKMYLQTSSHFVVPKAKPLPVWMNITQVYTGRTWEILLGTVIFYALFQDIILNYLQVIRHKCVLPWNDRLLGALKVFAVTINKCIKLPSSFTRRLIAITWIYFTLIFSSIFESTLVSYLIHPIYEKQVNSFQDIAKTDYAIYGAWYMKYLFIEHQNPAIDEIIHRWQTIDDRNLLLYIQQVIEDRNVVAAIHWSRLQYAIAVEGRFMNKDKMLQVHVLPSYSSYNYWIVMQRGLPLRDAINEFIDRATQSGFFEYYGQNITSSKYKSSGDLVHMLLSE